MLGIYLKLLSMKCLASNLKAFIIVDENDFIVKEKGSERTIACGPNSSGLYHLSERC